MCKPQIIACLTTIFQNIFIDESVMRKCMVYNCSNDKVLARHAQNARRAGWFRMWPLEIGQSAPLSGRPSKMAIWSLISNRNRFRTRGWDGAKQGWGCPSAGGRGSRWIKELGESCNILVCREIDIGLSKSNNNYIHSTQQMI